MLWLCVACCLFFGDLSAFAVMSPLFDSLPMFFPRWVNVSFFFLFHWSLILRSRAPIFPQFKRVDVFLYSFAVNETAVLYVYHHPPLSNLHISLTFQIIQLLFYSITTILNLAAAKIARGRISFVAVDVNSFRGSIRHFFVLCREDDGVMVCCKRGFFYYAS